MASSIPASRESDGSRLYENWVNPQWVRLLDFLQMNVRYSRCAGTELHAEDGCRILDFNSGYYVHNAGHNHPSIKAALIAEIERDGAAMLQTGVPELAGALAALSAYEGTRARDREARVILELNNLRRDSELLERVHTAHG